MEVNKKDVVLNFFEIISKIPRMSGHEEKIADYICKFAEERGLDYRKDNLYNVLVKKKASKGFENKEAIILQAHTDMVCEKTSDSLHDFEKDEIEIVETEETYTAKDTTLGADDGIGVATLLLMLDDEEIGHPDIYCLFTTQEEIGMDGAKGFDYSGINAKYLINVDGEEENTAIVGCAGGVRLCYEKNMELVDNQDKVYKIRASGLHGGHSGVDINKNRINSNWLTAQILEKLDNVKIISFVGGNKDNAIPNATETLFSTTSDNIKEVSEEVKNRLQLVEEDKNLKIEITEVEKESKSISSEESKEILDLIINLKQGVIEYSKDVEDLVESSGNVGIVDIQKEKSTITELIRSSDDEKKEIIKDSNNQMAQKYGYSVLENSSYPGWKYSPDSKIEKAYIESYKEVHNGEAPIVCAIHAGVECGMIYKKMPHLEMISMGPDLVDVHTVKETLYLKSCRRFLETFVKLIEKL